MIIDETKVAQIETLHPEATVLVKAKRLLAYERVVALAADLEATPQLAAALDAVRALRPVKEE